MTTNQPIAPFDLQLALRGEPVLLRCGKKAFVLGVNQFVNENSEEYLVGCRDRASLSWTASGEYIKHKISWEDIVGMWLEPQKQECEVFIDTYIDDIKTAQKPSRISQTFVINDEKKAQEFVLKVRQVFSNVVTRG